MFVLCAHIDILFFFVYIPDMPLKLEECNERRGMKKKRFNDIIEIVNKEQFVLVADLAERLQVSTMTIRRDLSMLDKSNMIERCHGGARSLQKIIQEADFIQKVDLNHDEKVNIAQRAVALLKPNDVVYLDSGSTTYEIARLIPLVVPTVNVVTNDLHIASVLAAEQISVTIVGGLVSPITKSALGRSSETFVSQFRFTKAFLGTSCIDRNFDTFSPNYDKAYLKRCIIGLSEESYLVVDQSKFYGISMSYVTSLNEYTGVITNKQFTQEELAQIRQKGIRLISECHHQNASELAEQIV